MRDEEEGVEKIPSIHHLILDNLYREGLSSVVDFVVAFPDEEAS